MTVEVKTSDVLFVPPGSSLPAAYAAASKDTATSNVLTCVQQLYSYLGRVPFGVLLTDQQLFCVRREGSTLLCSPSIPVAPVAAQQQDKAEGGRGGNASLTAVGALYGIMMMSKLWWAAQQLEQQQPQPQPLEPQGGRRGGELRPIPQLSPTPPPPAATESQLTSSQLFPGCNLGPPVPGETVPRCLGDSRWGVVMQGSLGGWPAAVKLVDLWQGREAKEAKEALQVGYVTQDCRVFRLVSRVWPGGWQPCGVLCVIVPLVWMLLISPFVPSNPTSPPSGHTAESYVMISAGPVAGIAPCPAVRGPRVPAAAAAAGAVRAAAAGLRLLRRVAVFCGAWVDNGTWGSLDQDRLDTHET